jgi:glutathione synthase/RimK-type ligase-like ATP-grasp enzyme
MSNIDLVILTESRYENPPEPNWYDQQVLTEDGLVRDALERKGLRVERVDWLRSNFDWSSTQAALFRSTWDYFFKAAEFSDWLTRVSAQTQLINPMEQIRWNLDKRYLIELQQAGINIAPTRLIEKGETCAKGNTITLKALLEETAWPRTVLKPLISGAARHTYLIDQGNAVEHEEILAELLDQESMMIQAYQNQIAEVGEMSLIVIGGRCTHAILKVAKAGEFRVQDDWGGTVHAHEPTAEEIAFAEQAVATCPVEPVYARVDILRDNDGQLALMELEMIEPELWFRFHPPAADALADAVVAAMEKPSAV